MEEDNRGKEIGVELKMLVENVIKRKLFWYKKF